MGFAINIRACQQCGRGTSSAVYCFRCYRASEAGKAEMRMRTLSRRYPLLEDGGLCRQCVHWYGRCTLGIPEGGTALAELCSAREVDSVLE